MKIPKILYLAIIICLSCEDVIEKDIQSESFSLVSPPDQFHSNKANINFYWQEVEGAFEYKIQIVKPSFESIEEIILDSITKNNNYLINLSPANYQWMVTAQNGNYQTISEIWNVIIDSTSNIQDLVINLLDPGNNQVINTGDLTFKWEDNILVEDYRFEIHADNWSGALKLPTHITTSNEYQISALDDGTYEWGVRGQNDNSNSSFSTFKLTIDKTVPLTPILSFPENGKKTTQNIVNFSWQRATDNGSSLKDSFFIYTDAALSNLARQVEILEHPSYSDSIIPGTYYWKVRTFDEAGNVSPSSNVWNFTIDP